jgi:hypothetical protein
MYVHLKDLLRSFPKISLQLLCYLLSQYPNFDVDPRSSQHLNALTVVSRIRIQNAHVDCLDAGIDYLLGAGRRSACKRAWLQCNEGNNIVGYIIKLVDSHRFCVRVAWAVRMTSRYHLAISNKDTTNGWVVCAFRYGHAAFQNCVLHVFKLL